MENEEQQLRKLHAVVDSLVNHRKGELHLTFLTCLCTPIIIIFNQRLSTEVEKENSPAVKSCLDATRGW